MKYWNKKGNTLQIWIEIIIFISVFIAILAIIGADMNSRYDKSNDLTFGLNLSSQMTALEEYKTTSVNDTSSGTTSLSDFGILKLLTTPKILLTGVQIIWSFISGGFISNLIGLMNLGPIGLVLGTAFQIIYVLAIVFILIKLVLRINA